MRIRAATGLSGTHTCACGIAAGEELMRSKLMFAGIGTTAALLAAVPVAAGPAAAHQSLAAMAVGVMTADYEMNEPVGSNVMTDSSGNGLDGVIQSSPEITTGFVFDGATGYHWVRRAPNQPPAVPERIIQVADNPNLEPGAAGGTFTIELRYRTKENFGNITQKGQATSRGGQWKIQNPQGMPSCLFKGSITRVATRVKAPLNDNLWHVLTCVHTSTRVTVLVDGVEVNHKNGSTGTIDNSIPMTVGGKINCDQINVTCDYFSGDIDYIRIWKG
jgi:hypothetical protein